MNTLLIDVSKEFNTNFQPLLILKQISINKLKIEMKLLKSGMFNLEKFILSWISIKCSK